MTLAHACWRSSRRCCARVDRHGVGAGGRRSPERAGHLRRQRAGARGTRAAPAHAAGAGARPRRPDAAGAADRRAPAARRTPPAAAAATEATANRARPGRCSGTVGEGGPEHLSDYQAPENPLQIGGQIYLRTQSTALQGDAPDRWSLSSRAVAARRLLRRAPEPARARLHPRAHELRPDRARSTPRRHDRPASAAGRARSPAARATGFTTFSAARGPNVAARPDVDPLRHRPARVRDRRQAARALGDGALLAADRLPAPAQAQPAGRVRRARRDVDAEAARPLGGRGAGTSTRSASSEDPNTASDSSLRRRSRARRRAPRSSSSAPSWASTRSSSAVRSRASASTSRRASATSTSTPTSASAAGEDFNVVVAGAVDDEVPTASRAPTRSARRRPTDRRRRHVRASPAVAASRPRRWAASTGRASTTTTTCSRSAPSTSTTSPATPTRRSTRACSSNQTEHAAAELLLHRAALRGAVRVVAGARTRGTTRPSRLSTLGNLSDMSFVSRLDYSLTLLTHLSFEAFVGVHYGTRGGRVPLGIDIVRADRHAIRRCRRTACHLARRCRFDQPAARRSRRRAAHEDLTRATRRARYSLLGRPLRAAAGAAHGRAAPAGAPLLRGHRRSGCCARRALRRLRAACAATIAARLSSAFPTGSLLSQVESTPLHAALPRKRVIVDHAHGRPREPFDGAQRGALLAVAERQRDAGGARARGAADAVHVALGLDRGARS